MPLRCRRGRVSIQLRRGGVVVEDECLRTLRPICGRPFELTRSKARVARRSCSRASCISALRRQIGSEVAARAEIQSRLLAVGRRRSGWPVRERVEGVPAERWATLSEADVALVRRFYGLPSPAGPGDEQAADTGRAGAGRGDRATPASTTTNAGSCSARGGADHSTPVARGVKLCGLRA